MLNLAELDPFVEHMLISDSLSGANGTLPYSSYSPGELPTGASMHKSWTKALNTEPGHVGWRRAWVVWADDQTVVGELVLSGYERAAALHRSVLGMGLQPSFRHQGLGKQLMATAIDWSRKQPWLDWIDLGVFDGNDAGMALYKSVGFTVVGRLNDKYRINGRCIDSISMTLYVG